MAQNEPNYRAAVIGLGFIGAGDQVSGDALGQSVANLDGTHAQALAGHPRVQLIAGASRDPGRRERFARRLGVESTYADWREMLAAEKPDIVSVATNSPYHAEITVACAEAGAAAVICEKPISTRLSDADRAIEACRQHGTLLVINHNRRWHPLWRQVRDEIAAGSIGAVQHASAHWPSGRLGNVGTHLFDALNMLLGARAEAVSGTLDPVVPPDCRGPAYHDPGGWGVIAYPGGVRGFIDAPHAAKAPMMVRIVGSLGQVWVRGNIAAIEPWSGSPRELRIDKSDGTSMDRAVQDVVHCLTTGSRPASSGEDALAALEMIIGFHVSDRMRGQWAPLPIRSADREMEVPIG